MIKIDSPLYLTTQCFRLGSSKNYSSIGKEFVFAGVVGVRGGGRNTQESRILIHILKKDTFYYLHCRLHTSLAISLQIKCVNELFFIFNSSYSNQQW